MSWSGAVVTDISTIMSKATQSIDIPVYRPLLGELERQYVNECLESGWISSRGEFIGRFESAFAEYVGAEHATSVCNGTVALHLALEALGLGPGDEVIVPTLTYIASVNTIIQVGARPIFIDSIERTWQLDHDAIKLRITPKTRAIMVVHLYGQPCDMDPIVQICSENGLLLIEDCAEAFGSYYKGRHVGTFGDAATFSFFGNKTITTGEGGMVLAKRQATIRRARHLKSQGVSQEREYWHDALAYNYRMTNICAAIGLGQLQRADQVLARKREIADQYWRAMQDLPLFVHRELPQTTHSYWMCSIALDDPGLRQPLRHLLGLNGIETRPVFHPAHTMPHCRTEGCFPVAESISQRGINLPSFPEMTNEQVGKVCDLIRSELA